MHIPEIDFNKLMDWGLVGWVAHQISSVKKSIDKLHKRIGDLATTSVNLQTEVKDHENRITHVEKKIHAKRDIDQNPHRG